MSIQRIAALLVMTAGFGWVAGDFAQPDKPLSTHVLITLIHVVPIVLTIAFALPLLERRDDGPRGARRGITAVAAFYTLAYVGIMVYSLANPDPNAFGIHSLGDWEAAVVMMAGNLLWLASLAPLRAHRSTGATVEAGGPTGERGVDDLYTGAR